MLCIIFYFIFCTVHWADLSWPPFSLLIIPCMIVYVTNKREPWTLNLELRLRGMSSTTGQHACNGKHLYLCRICFWVFFLTWCPASGVSRYFLWSSRSMDLWTQCSFYTHTHTHTHIHTHHTHTHHTHTHTHNTHTHTHTHNVCQCYYRGQYWPTL